MRDYRLEQMSGGDPYRRRWIIRKKPDYYFREESIEWQRDVREGELDEPEVRNHFWPADMRAEYERLTGEPEFKPFDDPLESQQVNVVEMIADNDCGFDQPCRYGYRVEQYAVYCHNDGWLYAPGKCRRHHGGTYPHEECPGFNPAKGD